MGPSGIENEHGWTLTTIVAEADGTVVSRVTPTGEAVPCPKCGVLSRRQHSWYTRRAMDLPWRGATVRLRVRSRRWFCDETGCARRIFAERFDGLLACGARRTNEATSLLVELGLRAGGEGGWLAKPVSRPVQTRCSVWSRSWVLPRCPRRVSWVSMISRCDGGRATPPSWSTRSDMRLSTCLPVAMPTRWLSGCRHIPVSRSSAIAVAHMPTLLVEVRLTRCRWRTGFIWSRTWVPLWTRRSAAASRRKEIERVHSETAEPLVIPTAPPLPPGPAQQKARAARVRRVARWESARALHADGKSLLAIARRLGINRKTVRKLVRTPAPPHNRPRPPRPSGLSSPSLQPFVAYLQDRWQDGCHNVSKLQRELEAQGCTTSRSLLREALRPWLTPTELGARNSIRASLGRAPDG